MTGSGTWLTPQALVLLALALVLLVVRLLRQGARERGRNGWYFLGVALLAAAAVVPMSVFGPYHLTFHMARHITLLLIIPPLLLSGADPAPYVRFLARPRVKKVATFLFHPVVAWLFGMSAMWLWQLPALFHRVAGSPLLATVQELQLLLSGLIFIWPVFAPVELRRLAHLTRALYLFLACTGCTVLGIAITFSPAGLYAAGGAATGVTGATATSGLVSLLQAGGKSAAKVDQEMAGLTMWVPACMIYITNVMISLARWYREGHETGGGLPVRKTS